MGYWKSYTDVDGLKFLGDYELSYEPWQFDLVGVWLDSSGYYVGTDSGCSCPTPWEYIGSVDSLTGPMTYDQMVEAVREIAPRSDYNPETGDYDLYRIKDEPELMEWLNDLREL